MFKNKKTPERNSKRLLWRNSKRLLWRNSKRLLCIQSVAKSERERGREKGGRKKVADEVYV